MRNPFPRSTWIGLLACMIAATPASPSTFAPVDLRSLSASSEAVVKARVVDLHGYWNDSHSMVFTDVTLAVSDVLQGSSDSQIVIRVPGGTVEGFTAEMDGAPHFAAGDDVVVFISRWRDDALRVDGYDQGVSKVSRNTKAPAGLLQDPVLIGGVAGGLQVSDLKTQLLQLQGQR